MSTRAFNYDHPTYLTPQSQPFTIAAGSGTTVRFAAFADMLAMALVLKPAVVGTAADIVTVFAVTNTTTKTLGVGTIASAQSTFSRFEMTTASRTCSQGDEIRIVKGTDATVVYGAALEVLVSPGANVTA